MISISDYFCPNKNCKCYGLRGQGNLVKAGTYKNHGVKRQMLKCKIFQHSFSETRNTIFFGSRYRYAVWRKRMASEQQRECWD